MNLYYFDNDVLSSRRFGRSILQTVYGFEDETTLEYLVNLNQRVLEVIVEVVIPGKWWIDYFPWLKNIPAWVPGAAFQKRAAYFRKSVSAIVEEPFEKARLNKIVSVIITHFYSKRPLLIIPLFLSGE